MSVLFPPRLAPGDVIGVTAPSSGVPEHLHPRLELAIKNLKKRGYQVREGRCLRLQHKNKSATQGQQNLLVVILLHNLAQTYQPVPQAG